MARLEKDRSLDGMRIENLRAIESIFGYKIGLLGSGEALVAAQGGARLFADRAYRPLDDEGHVGGVLELPDNLAPIILGDLHGSVNNLLKVLCENNFLKDIAGGKACLLLLGDVVHPEDGDLEDMESSAVMLDLIFKLKIKFPGNVFMLRGNHESFEGSMAKGGVPQGVLFKRWLKKHRGDTYVRAIETFFEDLPFLVRTDRYLASHAGPTRSTVDYETLVNVRKYPGLIHELTWNRLRTTRHPIGYTRGDVRRFRKNLGVEKDTPFVVGHTPQSPDAAFWVQAGNIRRHFIVYSAREDRIGVVVRVADRMVAMDYHGEDLIGPTDRDDPS